MEDTVKLEIRDIPAEELRVQDGDADPVVTGLGIPYGKWSEDLGGFKERIMPGAATEALMDGDVRVVFNHNNDFVLGRQSNGTARFTESKKGVAYEADVPDTQWARDLMVSIKRGDINQNSFAMVVPADGEKWERKEGMVYRTITKLAMLREMGPQTFPAYPQTDVHVRSLADVLACGERCLEQSDYTDPDVLARELELDELRI